MIVRERSRSDQRKGHCNSLDSVGKQPPHAPSSISDTVPLVFGPGTDSVEHFEKTRT